MSNKFDLSKVGKLEIRSKFAALPTKLYNKTVWLTFYKQLVQYTPVVKNIIVENTPFQIYEGTWEPILNCSNDEDPNLVRETISKLNSKIIPITTVYKKKRR